MTLSTETAEHADMKNHETRRVRKQGNRRRRTWNAGIAGRATTPVGRRSFGVQRTARPTYLSLPSECMDASGPRTPGATSAECMGYKIDSVRFIERRIRI